MEDSFLAEGFLLAKKIGLGQPKRLENAKVLVANTPMDTDKIKACARRLPAGGDGCPRRTEPPGRGGWGKVAWQW